MDYPAFGTDDWWAFVGCVAIAAAGTIVFGAIAIRDFFTRLDWRKRRKAMAAVGVKIGTYDEHIGRDLDPNDSNLW